MTRQKNKLLLSLFLISFIIQTIEAKPNEKLEIIATTSILGEWVEKVAGTRAHVRVLAGQDTDVHSFEPTPQDAKHLARSDIVFENGLRLEYWLDSLYHSSESKAIRIPLAGTHLKLLKNSHSCPHHHSGTHDHWHSGYDPHLLLDVHNAIAFVSKIADTLSVIYPQHRSYFQNNATLYIQQLQDLDAWIVETIAKLPRENRKLITNHDTFAYFAKRYQFDVLGSALGSISTEGADPSAKQFKTLVHLIKKHKVRAIFSENIQNQNLIDQLAHEAGLPQPKLLYTEALSGPNSPASTYINLMHYNVQTLVDALN